MSDSKPGFNPFAGLMAAAVPGLGHIVSGQVKRGLLAGGAVLGLFFGGILIGGVDVIDSREDRAWFIGQALVGPVAFVVDYYHQRHIKAFGAPLIDGGDPVLRSVAPDEIVVTEAGGRRARPVPGDQAGNPPNTKSVARVNEVGTLYATIAGMLNLIVVLDALMPSRRGRREDEK